MAFTYEYPRPALTVDCVVFGFDSEDATNPLKVVLIKRAGEPFKGQWALPGGFVDVSDEGTQGESLEDAARRELEEETGLRISYLEQLYTFGAPGRDPRGRVVSASYFALVRTRDHLANAGSDASEARWFAVAEVLKKDLAFDHHDILATAVNRLQGKVRYAPVGFNLLAKRFTLPELQALYEALLGKTLDKRNFRRIVCRPLQDKGVIVAEDLTKKTRRPGPAAQLYKFDKRAYDKAVRQGFNFEI